MLLFGRAAREIDLGSDKSSPVFPGSLQLNPLKETNLGVAHAPAQYGCTVSVNRYFFSSRITASDTFKGKTGQRRRRRQLRTAKKHWQKRNNFARASPFLYISSDFFLSSLHNYDVEMPNFTFSVRREHKTTILFFFSPTSI